MYRLVSVEAMLSLLNPAAEAAPLCENESGGNDSGEILYSTWITHVYIHIFSYYFYFFLIFKI